MNSVIYLGGGCFWCTESVYKNISGVISITPGYMGGNNPNPTYEEVCEGFTNHVEVIKVKYDNSLSLDKVLSIFFSTHDPTSINRQGADVGTQYRSAVFCNQDERKAVIDFIKNLEAKNIFEDKIVTEVNEIVPFYEAENYHHDFFTKNRKSENRKIGRMSQNFSRQQYHLGKCLI